MHATPEISLPTLHIRPSKGWLNDPNGVSRIDGRWHVFFQFNPAQPRHTDIHWGHVSSTDLVRWETHPIALAPRPGGLDSAGCWSGCLLDDDGVPTAVYTAVPGTSREAVTVLARSDRELLDWEQEETAVMGALTDPRYTETRDPYLFTFEGHRYAVLGTGAKGGRPAVLAWRCDDLRSWEPAGVVLDDTLELVRTHAPGDIFECPNLFPITDGADGSVRWVLVVSWAKIDGDRGVTAFVGEVHGDPAGLRFEPESAHVLDTSWAMYAPQALVDGERVQWWGWIQETDGDQSRVDRDGWSGAMTFPRDLVLHGGALHSVIAPETQALAREDLDAAAPITEPAFAVEHDGAALLEIRGPDGDVLFSTSLAGSGQAIVDGNIVEVYPAGGVPSSLRAYGVDGAAWSVSGAVTGVRRWGLE